MTPLLQEGRRFGTDDQDPIMALDQLLSFPQFFSRQANALALIAEVSQAGSLGSRHLALG